MKNMIELMWFHSSWYLYTRVYSERMHRLVISVEKIFWGPNGKIQFFNTFFSVFPHRPLFSVCKLYTNISYFLDFKRMQFGECQLSSEFDKQSVKFGFWLTEKVYIWYILSYSLFQFETEFLLTFTNQYFCHMLRKGMHFYYILQFETGCIFQFETDFFIGMKGVRGNFLNAQRNFFGILDFGFWFSGCIFQFETDFKTHCFLVVFFSLKLIFFCAFWILFFGFVWRQPNKTKKQKSKFKNVFELEDSKKQEFSQQFIEHINRTTTSTLQIWSQSPINGTGPSCILKCSRIGCSYTSIWHQWNTPISINHSFFTKYVNTCTLEWFW